MVVCILFIYYTIAWIQDLHGKKKHTHTNKCGTNSGDVKKKFKTEWKRKNDYLCTCCVFLFVSVESVCKPHESRFIQYSCILEIEKKMNACIRMCEWNKNMKRKKKRQHMGYVPILALSFLPTTFLFFLWLLDVCDFFSGYRYCRIALSLLGR